MVECKCVVGSCGISIRLHPLCNTSHTALLAYFKWLTVTWAIFPAHALMHTGVCGVWCLCVCIACVWNYWTAINHLDCCWFIPSPRSQPCPLLAGSPSQGQGHRPSVCGRINSHPSDAQTGYCSSLCCSVSRPVGVHTPPCPGGAEKQVHT